MVSQMIGHFIIARERLSVSNELHQFMRANYS